MKTAVSNSFGNTAVSTYTYEYDELGRRKSVKNTGSAFNNPNFNIYGYNDRSEVTASNSFTGEDLASKNNPLADRSRVYNYDPIGNRKTATEAASNLTYTANSLNQYESISGGANPETPAYDLDGNMTVAKGMILSYNAENRLIEATPQNPQQGSVKSTYIYDYMGRRAQKSLYTYSSGSWQKQKDISFIYDGWNMVKESEKTSDSSPEVPTYYVWGLDLSQSMQGAGGVGGLIASVKSGNEYLYSFDANGNVGQMVKAIDGSIAAHYEYDPFGKTLFAEGPMAGENPYRFSTKYQDVETGFYYYGYRYYDVGLGRWINRDPAMIDANIYVFVNNNALRNIDSLGLYSIDVHMGLTEYLARMAGFCEDDAAAIAKANQNVDEDWSTDPFVQFFKNLPQWLAYTFFDASDADVRKAMQPHFPIDPTISNNDPNANVKRASNYVKNEVSSKGSLNDFGAALHTYQDSYSHENFRNAHFTTNPDATYIENRFEKGGRDYAMAEKTYEILRNYLDKNHGIKRCCTTNEFDDIKNFVKDYLKQDDMNIKEEMLKKIRTF